MNENKVTMEIINSEQFKRANIRFNGKPAEEIREELKKEGWFYSRNHNVWYPKNDAAKNSQSFAMQIKEKYFPEKQEVNIITESSEKDELVAMIQDGSGLADILAKLSDMYGEDSVYEAVTVAREELEAAAYEKAVESAQKNWEDHNNGVEQANDERDSKEMNAELSRLDAEAEDMERANGLREMEADSGEEYFSPIGVKSNLANEDWNFINENPDLFKDWKYLAAFKFATEGKPITELTGKEFQKVENESIVTRVLDYYTDLYNNEVERKEIGVVTLDKEGIKDSLAHGMSSLKASAYAAVPKVIESGIIYNYEKNWKNRNYDTCVIIAPINIGGKVFAEEVVLKKRPNKTGFYLHEVELKEKLLEMFKTPTERSKSKSYLIIARHFDKVKNCNVILNENYEPSKEYVDEIRTKQVELSRLDTEAETMERANGLREMDYVMPDPDTIQDYHSELVKLGYEIINHEDGTGYISDPDGKLLAEWDKKDDSYRWAGPDNGGLWLANDDDWPDFEKEIYERHSKQYEEIRIAQSKFGDIVRGTFLALSDEEKENGTTVEQKNTRYEKWFRPMVDEIMAEIGNGNKEVMAIVQNFDLNHESHVQGNKWYSADEAYTRDVQYKLLPEMYEKVQDRIKKEYEEKKIPYVVMYSSESPKFPSENKVYTVKEFNEILLQADSEFHNRKKYAEEKYGSADNYWDLERDDKLPEEDKGIQFGYDKTNFKFFNIPNPNNPEDTFSYEPSRYDIGDGNGSVFDYVRSTCSHDEFIEALNALETQLYFPGVTDSQRQFVEKTVEEATQNLKATLKEKMEDLDKAQNEYKELHKKWLIEATEADRVDEMLKNALDGVKDAYDSSMNDVFTKVLNEYPFASGDVAGSEFLKYTANEVKKMAVSELYLPSRNAQKAMNAEDYKTYNSIDWAKLRRIWEKFPANVNMTAYAEKLLQDKCAEKGMSVSENTKAVTPPETTTEVHSDNEIPLKEFIDSDMTFDEEDTILHNKVTGKYVWLYRETGGGVGKFEYDSSFNETAREPLSYAGMKSIIRGAILEKNMDEWTVFKDKRYFKPFQETEMSEEEREEFNQSVTSDNKTVTKETELTPEDIELCKKVIPPAQFKFTMELTEGEEGEFFRNKMKEIADTYRRINTDSELTNEDGTHTVGFRYFLGDTEIFLSEIDSDGIGFGYNILNGDLQMSEWGSTSLEEIMKIPYIEMDYHVPEGMTIEAMLHKEHPDYFSEYAPKEETVEQVRNADSYTNEILDKFRAAGIEVVTDKEEFERILKEEQKLQKMILENASNENIQYQQQKLNGLTYNLSEDKIKTDTIAEDFAALDKSLRFNANFEIQSEKLGEEVSIFPGSTGKHGLGIRHIIEERSKKDNLNQDEITALSALILETVRTGDITRDSDSQAEFTKNGIVAIVRKDYYGSEKNWVLTGFGYNEQSDREKYREATEAIQTVIAQYSQSPDYSYFRNQVGAVITSLDFNISHNLEKSNTEKLIKNSTTYGFAHNGKIYLNPDLMNSEVAIHEYTHLWDKYTKRTNQELWNKGLEIFKDTKYWNEVISDPNYQDIKDDENLVLSEIHSRICGDIAEKVLERIAELDGEQVKLDAIDWNKEVYFYIREEFELDEKYKSLNFSAMNTTVFLTEFLSTPMKDLMASKNINVSKELSWDELASLFQEQDSSTLGDFQTTKETVQEEETFETEKEYKNEVVLRRLDDILDFHAYNNDGTDVADENGNPYSDKVLEEKYFILEQISAGIVDGNITSLDNAQIMLNDKLLNSELYKEISQKLNQKLPVIEAKPYNFFVNDTANLDLGIGAEFDAITGLTAEQAVLKYTELRDKGLSPYIGLTIPGDMTFDSNYFHQDLDPHPVEPSGCAIFTETEGKPSFYIGDNFVKGLKENDEHAQNVIAAYKELYENADKYILGVEKPNFVFDKEAELNRPAEPLKVYTFSPFGYEGTVVQVETDLRRGIPSYDIVGLADSAVKETRERIRAAFGNSGLEMPAERILQALSPADLRKDSPMDLAMALGILGQTKQYPVQEPVLALGELELSGRIRPVRGSVAAVNSAKAAGITNIICDSTTAELLKDIDGIKILSAEDLKDVHEKLQQPNSFSKTNVKIRKTSSVEFNNDEWIEEALNNLNMAGHFATVRAIEIAVAGKHNILATGAPGCGKTLLTQTLIPALTPKMTEEESKQITRINSLAGLEKYDKLVPPFRMPHQTATIEGICGGGPNCRPGEISLAHQGTLFMDETAEFRSSVIQMLRVPLESRQITLSRAGRSTSYPADFQLAMAMNPCPCGNFHSPDKICLCSARSVEQYWKKISDPLLDRVEIKTFVQKDEKDTRKISVEQMKTAIARAYEIQRKRGVYNSHLSPAQIEQFCTLAKQGMDFVDTVTSREELSPRRKANLLKTALTIANMDGREQILFQDLQEAHELTNEVFAEQKYRITQEQIDKSHSNEVHEEIAAYNVERFSIPAKAVGEVELEYEKVEKEVQKFKSNEQVFFNQLNDYLDNGNAPKNKQFVISKTPEILHFAGLDSLEMTFTTGVLNYAKRIHGLTNEELKEAIEQMANPILVFDSDMSKTENKVPSVLTITAAITAKNKPIAIAINTNIEKSIDGTNYLDVNDIRSIHDRTLIAKNNTNLIEDWINKRLCKYYNDKKISDWQLATGVSFPAGFTESDNYNIKTYSDFVNSQKTVESPLENYIIRHQQKWAAKENQLELNFNDPGVNAEVISAAEEKRKRILEPILNGERTEMYKSFKNFEDKGVFEIKGAHLKVSKNGGLTPTGWKQLQAAMEIYRSKEFETFRYILIDDKTGEIKDQLAITSHMPNFCNVSKPNDETLKQVISRAEELDCKIAVCHNHPSGNTTESSFDRELTDSLDRSLRRNDGTNKFLGHIILDHDTFNLAVPSESRPGNCYWKKIEALQANETDRFVAEQNQDMKFMDSYVGGTHALKEVAKQINDTNNWNDDFIPVVFTNADRSITGVQYYSKNFFENDSDKIRAEFQTAAKDAGAIGAFPVITDYLWDKLGKSASDYEAVMKAHVMNDAFTDVAFNHTTMTEKYDIEAGRNYYSFYRDQSDRQIDVDATWTPEVNPRLFPPNGVGEHSVLNRDDFYKVEFKESFVDSCKGIPPHIQKDEVYYTVRCSLSDLAKIKGLKKDKKIDKSDMSKKIEISVTKDDLKEIAKSYIDKQIKAQIAAEYENNDYSEKKVVIPGIAEISKDQKEYFADNGIDESKMASVYRKSYTSIMLAGENPVIRLEDLGYIKQDSSQEVADENKRIINRRVDYDDSVGY